jgi:hypothetical protein
LNRRTAHRRDWDLNGFNSAASVAVHLASHTHLHRCKFTRRLRFQQPT